jgi:hypothetical protein
MAGLCRSNTQIGPQYTLGTCLGSPYAFYPARREQRETNRTKQGEARDMLDAGYMPDAVKCFFAGYVSGAGRGWARTPRATPLPCYQGRLVYRALPTRAQAEPATTGRPHHTHAQRSAAPSATTLSPYAPALEPRRFASDQAKVGAAARHYSPGKIVAGSGAGCSGAGPGGRSACGSRLAQCTRVKRDSCERSARAPVSFATVRVCPCRTTPSSHGLPSLSSPPPPPSPLH